MLEIISVGHGGHLVANKCFPCCVVLQGIRSEIFFSVENSW